jgi:hypothetical protein
MKIKGSSEGTSCDCILGEAGLLLKFKGFFGGDKGEELIKYDNIRKMSLAKSAGLVSSPLLIIETPDGIKKVVLLNKKFDMFLELLEKRTNTEILDYAPLEDTNHHVNKPVDQIVKEPVDQLVMEPLNQSDSFEQIEKAKKLLDMGAITEEEFNSIKEKYLKKF